MVSTRFHEPCYPTGQGYAPVWSDASLDEREADLEQQVRETSKRKMLNLSAYSNTDLIQQGFMNLAIPQGKVMPLSG